MNDWWQIDRLHLTVRASASHSELPVFRAVADAIYFDMISRVGDQFAAFVEDARQWPPVGAANVSTILGGLWEAGPGRRGVIFSDALRLDLAHELAEQLDEGSSTLDWTASTLPSNTPLGMTTLLPSDESPLVVDFGGGKATLSQAGITRLEERDSRKEFLKRRLTSAKQKTLVAFIDLDELLQSGKVPSAPVVVVFDQRIDEQGHKGTDDLPSLVGKMVRNLKRAVDTLHNAGIGTVHVVTDHGFLLLPPDSVDGLGTPLVPPTQYLYKHPRWVALKSGVQTGEVLTLPLPAAPQITLGFARGVRTLEKAEQYLHGGISLQECVIPHLVSRRSMPQIRLGVDVQVTIDKLPGGTVPVVLRPHSTSGQAPLGGFQPITVRLSVDVPGDPPRTVAGPLEVEVRDDVDELKPPLYLQPDLGLQAGQTLVLKAIDADTGQDLGTKKLTLMVDWD